jgi:glycosyltransferase involved in cell wall biosynthesis
MSSDFPSQTTLPANRNAPLQVALSTTGVFHSFDMARQLENAGMLAGIHTGYPKFKLRNTGVPRKKIHSFPWLKGPYMAGWVPDWLRREWEYWDRISFDRFVAATLPDCEVFCGLSGSALQTGRLAQRRGALYVCDRGSSHIRFQDSILRDEYDRQNMPYRGTDPRTIFLEEAEYAQADAILVPSNFAYRSFVEMGTDPAKLYLAPYGVDLSRFTPVSAPRKNGFDALFVGGLSIRKGAHYLFGAFERLVHPAKTLTIAGVVAKEIVPELNRFQQRNTGIRALGHVPQDELKALMSGSHVLLLPSVEEGFGLVQAQAMACGCPVIASRNTGAENLFQDGQEGFIVPARDTDALANALQALADDADLQARLARASLDRVQQMGGWHRYGEVVISAFKTISNSRTALGIGAEALS